MIRRISGKAAVVAVFLVPVSGSAQEVIYQQQPNIFQRVFAPVVETVETITTPVPNQVYVSSPGQTVITNPSRITTTTTVVQTQTRINDPVFDSLARQLRDILPDRRREAAFALGQLRNPRAVPLLMDRIRVDLNKNVRKACVVALSQIPDPAIPGYLERVAIYDPNAEVRLLASNLMRKLTESVVVETPIEIPATTIIQEEAVNGFPPATQTVPAVPSSGSTTQIQGGLPPTTAQVPGSLRPRTSGNPSSPIISSPIETPAVNPLAPSSEPMLKEKEAAKPATKPGSPVLSPPTPTEAPPLEALPEEIPQNSRNTSGSATPRSA
ncbi:MAG: hypothetical protein RJA81_1845 [Planctomycetota bacterium]|jgi:hypothetical protein